jgi:hypothetical protein
MVCRFAKRSFFEMFAGAVNASDLGEIQYLTSILKTNPQLQKELFSDFTKINNLNLGCLILMVIIVC